jgi:uncharacterized protein (DUF924 family)
MSKIATPKQVLSFWRKAGPKRWFKSDPDFDHGVLEKFLVTYQAAELGKLAGWEEAADSALALVIVLDQFPRNMFRGTPRAFATDALALDAARQALARGFDRGMLAVERLFFYLPFEHSEALADQELACELTRPLDALEPGLEAYRYAVLHRDVIRRFGRFPHRNAILGRASTPEELEFLQGPGSSF